MNRDDWADLDATAQAELVETGQATATELVEAAIRRIEGIDDALGAVPVRSFDDALRLAESARPGAPFAGVPFLMKDVGARQKGRPYYAANRALRDADHRADSDTPLGARFRELGLVTLGNSSTPEFGLQSNTWPLIYGPTRNPWDPGRAAGGSSGGACAAVAAGLVPVAHASDGAGSIRIPASWCGLIGLKPSRDRVVWRHAGQGRPDVEFVVARSLRDTVSLLDLLTARRTGTGEGAGAMGSPSAEPRRLRVAFTVRSPAGSRVDESCKAAVERAVGVLARFGHSVTDEAPPALYDYEARALNGAILGPLGYRECLEDLEERLGRPVSSRDVEPFLWELAALSQGEVADVAPEDVHRAVEWTQTWERSLLDWFTGRDVLVTPTVHEPAPALASLDPETHDPMELLEKMVPHMAFTEPWNSTGQPAMSLPLGWTPNGLPVGVQLIGRPGAESDLFAAAGQLLAELGEPDRRPATHA